MMSDDLWQLETAFWTANPDEARHALDPHCLMAFPPPAGIVSGDQIISSMRAAPRWHTVVMVDKYLHQPAVDLVVLAYFVSARRNGGGAYTAETFVRNPLTLAILLASPVLVVGMFAILFRPGAFESSDPSPSSMVMIGFWIVFAAFFFGITYGLLQICTERTIVQPERLVGLRLGAYVASKVTVLVPFLLVVIVAMLGILRLLDRLPSRPLATYASMAVSLLLCAIAALGLGLLASASVKNVAQATLALPMLCFPAVLFSGAILPVHLMANAGVAMSTVIPSRWAFEAIGHDLGARQILAQGGSPLGPPLLASYGDAGTASTPTYWLILAAFGLVFLLATWGVLNRTTRSATR